MRAFVTGATGFVGGHVAQALSRAGWRLRLLRRPSSRVDHLKGLDAEFVTGDLADPEGLREGLEGCDALVHVAADYRLWIPDPEAMLRVNVEGTRALLRLAREAGVRRVVHTSSVATLRFGTDGAPSDEDTPTRLEDLIGHYKRSKFLAEREALAAEGLEVVVVNPSAPVGPGDAKPTPTGRILVDFLRGRFPATMDTGLNVADVREIARGHVRALERGRPGRRYILGGENLTLTALLEGLGRASGLKPPRLRIPYAVALAYAAVEETVTGRLLGREPRATVEEVRMGAKKMYVSSARAEAELGYRVAPAFPALQDAVDWFRGHGYA